MLATASVVWAVKLSPFSGGDEVKDRSPNIIIARYLKTVENPSEENRGLIYLDIEITSVLKGSTNLGPAHLRSSYQSSPELNEGEQYLVFSISHDRLYDAIEPYRIVPLGKDVPPNLIANKTLDGQIQALFQYRLDQLNRQMKDEQEEKERLKQGLKELSDVPSK